MFSTVCQTLAVCLCFFTEFEHFIFSFSYFSQLFVEITCQEIVEKLISCYMVLWIKCLSTSFLFPPSAFHVYIIPVLKRINLFCHQTVLCLVFLKVCLICSHCCELTTIWSVLALCL